ncbi:MAG TPA: hypothetical protein VF032_13975 [Thermoleophilaceae bacterium]
MLSRVSDAVAPLRAAADSHSGSAALLALAALALMLAAVASGSMLRLLMKLSSPRRGW